MNSLVTVHRCAWLARDYRGVSILIGIDAMCLFGQTWRETMGALRDSKSDK